MKKLVYLLLINMLCVPVIAAVPISYQQILAAGAGTSDEENAVDKEFTVRNARDGMFGYFVKIEDSISFICRSGDAALVKGKLKNATFKGTTLDAQPHDGMTTWNLKNCQRIKSNRAQ